MRRGVLFKNKTIEAEWPNVYPPLRDRLLLLADYVNREFDKPFTITCLSRTANQNSTVGGKTDSLHMANPCRAADIRTSTWFSGRRVQLFSTEQIVSILDFWRKGGTGFGGQFEPDKWHIHVQVKK